ncbi:hypothetical protein [Shewanella khirikhana]|uniref:Uncharacterized protein n=1 Tax=Shewanella khirikhana TaxID=1965282 RepID=A0ABM7DXE3_9GAMM|nr:hypothetical protein [Shewanella khirikhana]AZQ13307.1 hypothetical protein STH12_04281 [Shewanella khirikhana]
MAKAKQLTEWQKGVLYAAAWMIEMTDQPGDAAELIISAGLEDADCSSLDDYEKERLREVKKSVGLKGLS